MVSALTIVGIVAAAIVVLVVSAYLVSIYNALVRLDKKADQAKQNIDVKLTQRQDTLNKLIETVSEYMDYEERVLKELTEAREAADRASTPAEAAAADEAVRSALATLNARAEEYPELRSAENMQQLQEEISRLEEEISDRREFYNDAVTIFNTRIKQIPHVFFANMLGYTERELFEAMEAEKADVDIGAAFGSENATASGAQ